MKELFLTTITKPTEVIVNKFFYLCVCFLFPCSKGQAVRAYLLRNYLNDLSFEPTITRICRNCRISDFTLLHTHIYYQLLYHFIYLGTDVCMISRMKIFGNCNELFFAALYSATVCNTLLYQLKVAFFRKRDVFFKSPKKYISHHYPELEI